MIKLKSLHNFRNLTPKQDDTKKSTNELDSGLYDTTLDNPLGDSKIYRSSKPDHLAGEDLQTFCALNFRTIIDFRSHEEYKKGDGDNLLDKVYSLYEVKVPQWRNYNVDENILLKPIKSPKNYPRPVFADTDHENGDATKDTTASFLNLHTAHNPTTQKTPISTQTTANLTTPKHNLPHSSSSEKRHILINFFNYNFLWDIFNRISIFNRIIAVFILLYDIIFGTDKRHFVRYFAKHCLNKPGVKGLYIDILNLAQAPIYAALKLLTEPSSVPVMINCAHGKDRTGIMSALILSTLGYSREHIISDFARSAEELEPIREQIIEDIVGKMRVSMSFVGTEPGTMQYVFDYIDQNYGGVTSYLEKIGFSIADQNLLRENLSG